MAKISFAKLGLKINQTVVTIPWNEQEIEIREYVPITEKMSVINTLIQKIIEKNERFYNPGEVHSVEVVTVCDLYTNLNFTDKQLSEDIGKTYDLLECSGLATAIYEKIPQQELALFHSLLNDSIKGYYDYNNSLVGILEAMSAQRSNLQELQELVNNNDLSFLKEVLGQMG